MKNLKPLVFLILFGAAAPAPASAAAAARTLEVWELSPAPNRGPDWSKVVARGTPYDDDWELWSHPIGNGYMGANVFGRVDTERIQITEKTLHTEGPYARGGLTNFAELYLHFNHGEVTDYRRSLNLDEAIAKVSYQAGGVTYRREHFLSYPDNVLVVRLTADQPGALSLAVRAEIPYLGRVDQRTGTVTAEDNLITLAGSLPYFSTNYEGQLKVLNTGGTITADRERGLIEINQADDVVLLFVAGTNYTLSPETFIRPPAEKSDPNRFPHAELSARLADAEAYGFAALKQRHLVDYQDLFRRVTLDLIPTPSSEPTSRLLEKYQAGDTNTRLEELMFHYGRYLLIASSREKTLPANLQGTWSQYYLTPWSGGFWHNINVQMNYWGAMSANLAETFEAYLSYFQAYLPKAREFAREFVQQHNPDRYVAGEDHGWILGTGANAYYLPPPGGHSGPGTGGFTTKLLMEYYNFSRDPNFLREVAYPALRSMSVFYSKALTPYGDRLLIQPSASPEQRHNGIHYVTVGATFDQGFVWENFNDTLILAKELGVNDAFLETLREQLPRLDPILIGASGQIKEYREEVNYSDIGDPRHRHISHLCPLYPGTLINSSTPEWMQAASKTLDLRGVNSRWPWPLAHQMNARARLKEGDEAHAVYQTFLRLRVAPNLWTKGPPFNIDGNLGVMAGIVEMLLQSHEGFIEILPALPAAWPTGSFSGLVARGNFVVNAEWRDGRPVRISLTSRSGGECRLKLPGGATAEIRDSSGAAIAAHKSEGSGITFDTTRDVTYHVSWP